MKPKIAFFLSLLLTVCLIRCTTTKHSGPSLSQLPAVIDSLYRADQGTMSIQPADSAAAAYQRIIRSNFPAVKNIFNQYEFPGYDLVGKETSGQYFLLVQHSDFAPAFQRKVLKAMKKQVLRQNASGQQFAMLTDRVELNHGRPQVYGTQVQMSANTVVKPCIDPENLNKRRLSVGLSTIEVYLQKCNEVFYELNPHMKPPGGKK